MDAARILACEVLALPWAAAFDWQGLAAQAHQLEPDHRTHGRETIPVRALLPTPPPDPAAPLPETGAEIERIVEALRRAIRLANLAYTTEQTYVHWNVRFTRFCLIKLKQTPQAAGTVAITAYLDYLALERQVSKSTQKQALNAIVFLTRKVFGIEEFAIEKPASATGGRRPPVVMTREEVREVLARLENPWKLAAQIMYGSGLRLAECLRLRVKDLDFGQLRSRAKEKSTFTHSSMALREPADTSKPRSQASTSAEVSSSSSPGKASAKRFSTVLSCET